MTLEEAFARRPEPVDDWEGRHRLGPVPTGALTIAELASGGEALAIFVARKRAQAKGGDLRLGCAYLIGDLGWEIGGLLGGLWLSGWRVAAADPAAVAVALRDVAWEEDGASGTSAVIDLTIAPAGLQAGGQAAADLARAIHDLLAPLVAALAQYTQLGQAAQWRLVSDGLTAALLQQGRLQGRMTDAILLGRSVTASRATPLHSKKLELVEVVCPDDPRITDWFRLRGGCCRYYTATGESGDYCTTCVHRDRADQLSRLQDYLGRTRLGQLPVSWTSS